MTFTQNGRTLATGGADHTIRLWDSMTGLPGRTLGGQGASVEAAAIAAAHRILVNYFPSQQSDLDAKFTPTFDAVFTGASIACRMG